METLLPSSRRFGLILIALLLSLPAVGRAHEEPVDLEAIYRIKQEGLGGSQVMEIVGSLTDVHGPRLTNSPQFRRAAEYAVGLLEDWGLEDARLEPWGEFGRGWSNERFVAHVVEPVPFPLIGYPKAWTPGTDGPVTAEAVIAVVEDEADLDDLRGTLAGKIVLVEEPPDVDALWEAPARRLTPTDLAELTREPEPAARRGRFDVERFRRMRAFRERVREFLVEEGVAAVLEPGGRGSSGTGGTLFVGSGGDPAVDADPVPPQVVLTSDHYGRLYRILERELPVRIELDIRNVFHDGDLEAHNVVAELPGTDLADEVVMLGAHFDSWHAGTGATDNAAGSAAIMEAMRILRQAGLRPRRTIRIALWSGEEQGLLGSRAYVRQHFGDPETMELLPAHDGLAAYYNLDNGTGAIRGVYLQGNEAVAPIFAAWMQPLESLGMTTLAIRDTGGTDHLAFDAVGLPGFQFIQDPVEYGTRSHHSNMDTYERLQAADMIKNAVIIATFAYHTANRDEPLPRKPLKGS